MSRQSKPEQTEIVDDGGWLDADQPAPSARGYVRGDESAAGDWQPRSLGDATASAFAVVAKRLEIGSNCESPIEEALGAEILAAAELAGIELRLCQMMDLDHQDDGLLLVPQFRWSIYRSDWAILKNRKGASALLIECDGREFHSSREQQAHDARKDTVALDRGHMTIRFTGSDIFRKPKECAAKVLELVTGGST